MEFAAQFSEQHRDLLLEISLLVSERRGIDEIFAAFAGHIRHGATFDFTSLFVVTADPNLVRTVGNYPQFEGAWQPGSILHAADTGADRVAREPDGTEYRPERIDIEATRALVAQGYMRCWTTPLYVEGQNYGMLSVAKKSPERFADDQLRFLKAAAVLLATAVRQDLELERARRSAARAQAASELVLALQAGEPIDDIFKRLPALLADCLDVDYVGLVLDQGTGFVTAAEAPEQVFRGLPPDEAGSAVIRQIAEGRDFVQVRVDPDDHFQGMLATGGFRRTGLAFLRDGDELRGMVLLARRSSRRFDSDELTFIELLRSVLAQSLANQRRFVRTEAAGARARTLNELALLLNAGEAIEAIFQRLLDVLHQSLDVDYIGLIEAVEPAGTFRQVGSRPELVRQAGQVVSTEEAGLPDLLANGLRIFQYSTSKFGDRSAFTRAMRDARLKRAVSVVIESSSEIRGILSLARANGARFTPDEEEFLKTLSAMLGQAMEAHARLRAAEREAARQALLSDLAILLTNGETLEAFFDILAAQLQRAVPFSGLVLMVETAEPESYRVVQGLRRRSFAPGQIVRKADFGANILARFDAGEFVCEGDTEELGGRVALAARSNGTMRGAVSVIRNGAQVVGYLLLGRNENLPFTPSERSFIELVSALAGQSIANLRKVQERQVQAIRSRVISELSALLQGGGSIQSHFDTVSKVLLEAVGFDFLSITSRDPASGDYGYIRSHELVDEEGRALVFDPAGMDRVAREGEKARQYRTAEAGSRVPTAMARAGFRRAATVVIPGTDGPEGLLTIGRRDDAAFSDDEMVFIGLLGTLFGQATANYRKALFRAREERRNRVLGELALVVNDGQPIATHFARLCELLANEGYEFCALTARTADRQGYQLMRSQPLPGDDGVPHPERIAALRQGGAHSVQFSDETIFSGLPTGFFETGIRRAASVLLSAGTSDEGLLTVGRHNPEPFTPEEMTFFELVGTLLAYAIANEGRIAASESEAEEQAIIAEAAAAVARESSPLAITRALRGAVSRFIGAPYVAFGFLEPGVVEFVTRDGPMWPETIGEYFTRAFAEGQVAVPSTSARVRSGEQLPDMERIGVEAHLLTTAYSAGDVVGLLLIGSRDEAFVPGPREARLCRLIADIVGPAMANARSAQQQRWEAEDQRVLAQVGAVAAREGSPQEILRALRAPLASVIPHPLALFGFRESDSIVLPLTDGTMGRVPLGPYAELLEQEGQIHGDEVPEDLAAAGLGSTRLHAVCATAVRSAGATVGYLILGSRDESFAFDQRTLDQCRRIAQVVGPAMENARASLRARLDAEEQSILAEAAAAVAAGREEREIAVALRQPIQRFVPGATVMVYFLQGDELTAGGSSLGQFGPQTKQALETGQVVVSKPWPPMSDLGLRMLEEAGMEQFAITSLNAGGESRGILFVGSRDLTVPIGERASRLLRLICDIAGPAFANARESARRAADAEEQRFLAETASAAARATSERELLHGLWAPFRRFIPQARIAFFFHEPDGMRLPGRSGALFPTPPQVRDVMALGQSSGSLRDANIHPDSRAFFESRGIYSWVDTTVATGGEPLGLFFVGTKDPDYVLEERDLRLCRLVADIVGPAMANIRESRRRQEDAEEQRILAEAASAIAAGTSEADILSRLVKPIRAFVPRARVSFSYVEHDQMWTFDGSHRRPVHAHAGKAISTGQAVGEIGVTEITPESYRLITGVGVVRWVDTVAHSGGTATGLLWVGTPEDYQFSERDLRRLRLIADVIGPAMVNARDEARRSEEAEDERVLSEVASMAARASLTNEIVQSLPLALAQLVPGAVARYGFIEGDYVTYQNSDVPGAALSGGGLTLALSPVGRAAIESGQAVGTLSRVPTDHPAAPLALHQYALSAYTSGGVATGLLMVATTDPAYRFSERSLALLKRITQVVGPAVEAARAEAERARQAELYSLMLRSLSEGVVLCDIEGKVVFANAMGRTILSALDPAGTESTWESLIEQLPAEAREGYRAVYERGEGSRGRTRLVVQGRDRWFDYELVPLTDPVMKILLVAADVTADVEREQEQLRHRDQMEQAQRLAALGELIGGVAHELNNPLTAILGFAEVMSLSPEAAPLSEDLGVIQKEALRARNIVRDLLFIVRPGTSERSLIPVSDLMGHIERLRRTAWTQQGIGWEINIQEPCMVWGNEHQLTQVMLNLVTNAEHALQGVDNPRIAIRAVTRAGRTQIEVSDTGAGMDEATRNRVFEPFFTTKQGHGTGLGLPLSYSIVQSHDGQISVVSTPGEGTTFTINVPASQGAPGAVDELRAAPAQGVIRVLVVDDEPSLRKVCQRLISSMGHECDVAENSAAALDLAQRADFDVVLCDYRLATETANDVVQGFERVAPALVNRVVIATGATTDPGVVELTERYGLKLIAKPYGVDDLAAVIQRAS